MEITITIKIDTQPTPQKSLIKIYGERLDKWIKDDGINYFPKNENLN